MKNLRPIVWTVLSLLFITPLIALTQNGECSALVKAALEATDKVCSDTSRNQACYGHIRLEAIPQSQSVPFKFNEVGDRVDVAHVGSLRLSPMDMQNDVWGVALMRVQADIPDKLPDTNVTMLVFGDVEVNNAVPEPVLADAIVKGPSNANIRRQPSNRAFVIASVPPGGELRVKGRSEDGAWLYIDVPGEKGGGWVRRSLLKSENDLTTLKVIDPALTAYGPMQAFFLKSGNNQTSCASTPSDGILIQTPEGAAQVRLWINEVKIKLGSTAFIQTKPNEKTMTVSTLEGEAHVEALGVEQVAVAGTSVTVRIDENRHPVAPPSLPQAYVLSQVEQLPVENLERNITIAAPLNETFTPTASMTFTATDVFTLTATDTEVPSTNTATRTPTNTALPRRTRTPTNTVLPPTSTMTDTLVPPTSTATDTDVPPTDTDVPPTDTNVPPTDTDVPPATDTDVPLAPTMTYTPEGFTSGQGSIGIPGPIAQTVPPATDTDVPPAPTMTYTPEGFTGQTWLGVLGSIAQTISPPTETLLPPSDIPPATHTDAPSVPDTDVPPATQTSIPFTESAPDITVTVTSTMEGTLVA